MSQVADGKRVLSGDLEALYAPVAQDLARVEEVLGKQLRSPHPFVNELVRYGLRLGGKRLRPALLLLAARATGAVAEPHVILGAVVEMIHTATLVHDDILDEATLRRHARTINDRWDNETSVLFGDRVVLLPWLERLGSIQYAYAMAGRYADEARARLEPLPLNPARENLMRLARFVIDRRH